MANTSDYIAAGRAGARGVRDSFIAARQNARIFRPWVSKYESPLSNKAEGGRRATGKVVQEGVNAVAKVENTKTKIQADQKVLDTKLGAKRFAGIVGGLGTVAVAGMSFAAPKEDDSSWKDKHYAAQDALQKKLLDRLNQEDADDGEVPGLKRNSYLYAW